MELTLHESRSGALTCAADAIWLHSPYDPEREAFRFAQSEIGASHPSHLIVLGPCLDYISTALHRILPGARVIAIQYSAFFEEKTVGFADAAWDPKSDISLDAFLDDTLDEDAIAGVSVLEWEPATRAFPDAASLARTAVRTSLDRLTSSAATVKAYGKRWIANACTSFLLVEGITVPRRSTMPILIAAAGPSLNDSLVGLSKIRNNFLLVAVSSALAACCFAGLEPDLVVSTDGGYWSRLHLYPFSRERASPMREGPPLATPLTALPSASLYKSVKLLLLDQGSFAESELMPSLGPSLRLPPHGTVSGSALQLAARLTDGPIIAAGLDLAVYGDREHTRPNGFDPLLLQAASRASPLEGIVWSRSLEAAPQSLPKKPWRTSRALTAYASALSLDSRSLEGRLFRLGPAPFALSGFAEVDERGFEALAAVQVPREEEIFTTVFPMPRARREAIVAERIASWRSLASETSFALSQGVLPKTALVAELLRSIDIVDYAAARRAILAGGNPKSAAEELSRRCDLFLSALERRFAS